MDGGASIENESSKQEASKDEVHLVEQVRSSSDSLDLSEEEEENPKHTNIPKKPIMNKWSEKQAKEAKRVKEAQEAREAQEAKEAYEAKLHLKAEEILQVAK